MTQPFLLDAARAAVDPAKLRDCCLNPDHARGRYKARAFRAALGSVQADAPWLREAILAAVRTAPAVPEGSGRYGERWRVDLALTCRGRSAIVRTIWLSARPAARRGWSPALSSECSVLAFGGAG